MPELISLTTPIVYNTVGYTLASLNLDVENSVITVHLKGTNGEFITKQYDSNTNPSGATLLHQLNTANFSVNSLMKAIYNRLITDGVLVGTVSGTPT